jgi:transitional endoplasmic reticulum ATPase
MSLCDAPGGVHVNSFQPPEPPSLEPLREAVRLSPDNVPLRRHLGDMLLGAGQAAEAEQAYREALALAPGDREIATGLARAFSEQDKHGEALVLLEDLLTTPEPHPTVHLLAARVLLATGERDAAGSHYRQAVGADPGLADADLAARLDDASPDEVPDPFVVGGRVRAAWDEDVHPVVLPPNERPAVTFADVGGMDEVKEEVRLKILLPLTQPELYKAYGKQAGGGILMYGPPGCGKTHLARATAGEAGADFISVGLDEILDMWIGSSERNLHEVFERARFRKPCVLFFDEVDALGASRSDMRGASGRHVINQFLAELDGVKSSNEGILVLAATNAPWHLDPAFRRPGRFDRVLLVPPPDAAARAAILRIQCRGKPVDTIDYDHLAARTPGFSGADLKAVVDRCVEAKLRESMLAGSLRPLTTRDLAGAARAVTPSTREWFATARNYALHANQGGTYDDVLRFMDQHS